MADFAGSVHTAVRKKFEDPETQEHSSSAESSAAAAFAGNEEVAGAASQLESLMKEATSDAPVMNDVQPEVAVPETIEGDAAFAVVEVDRETMSTFAREYSNLSKPVSCIADCQMLLEYMVGKERANGVTVSFHACGVDPVVFDQVAEEAGEGIVPIKVPSKEEPALYEKILVDGVLYLSCLSECLHSDYLHQVISEATEAIFVHGVYTYTMVGPRPIDSNGGFISTLKLNSYEMSVLMAFMDSLDGVSTKHCVENGRATIKFVRG